VNQIRCQNSFNWKSKSFVRWAS